VRNKQQNEKKIMKIKTMSLLLAVAASLLFNVNTHAADSPALMPSVKLVFDHYLKIQADLANDSLKGVPEEANAIVKAVQGDSIKMLPETAATQAEALAKGSDLKAARTAFKPLSDSLIKYLAEHHAKNAYVEVYCPMAKASWLQADKNVNNPYLGQEMPTCGEIKN
jgi:hypothetical protein